MGIALDEGDLTILKVLSDTTLSMIEGEILGMEKEGSLHVTREEALEITRRKTADLFAAACRLPAHFAPRGDLVAAERLGEYGRCLGMAFQLIDDLLDYTGSEQEVGKPVLNDLREGKLTMPLLLALPKASPRGAREGRHGPARARLQERRARRHPVDRGPLRRHRADARPGPRLRRRRARGAGRLPGFGREGRPSPGDRIDHRSHPLTRASLIKLLSILNIFLILLGRSIPGNFAIQKKDFVLFLLNFYCDSIGKVVNWPPDAREPQ